MPPSSGATSAPLCRHPLTLESEPGNLSRRMPNDSSDDMSSCPSYNLDSIDRRRRHGEYFHRPPVWFPRPCSYGSSSATSCSDDGQAEKETIRHTHNSDEICPNCSAGLDHHDPHRCPLSPFDLGHGEGALDAAPAWDPSATTLVENGHEFDLARPVVFPRSTGAGPNTEQHIGAPIDTGLSEMYYIAQELKPEDAMDCDFYYQRKVALCTRLQSYRDIRCPPDQQWAMREGSLVVGLQPSFVGVIPGRFEKGEWGELDLRLCNIYLIVSIYADLWALCLDLSLDIDIDDPIRDAQSSSLGFLPLCAVTLPGNLGPFLKRCGGRLSDEDEIVLGYPWSGQVVVPPRRSHSLKALAEITQPGYKLRLQPATQELLKNFALLSGDEGSVVPLDAPVKDLVDKMRYGRKGGSWLQRMLKRRESQVRANPQDEPSARSTTQGLSLAGPATNSTRSDEAGQPERLSRSQYVYRAVSHSFGKLFGLFNKESVPESSENRV